MNKNANAIIMHLNIFIKTPICLFVKIISLKNIIFKKNDNNIKSYNFNKVFIMLF